MEGGGIQANVPRFLELKRNLKYDAGATISTQWFISGWRRAETVSLQSECGCR